MMVDLFLCETFYARDIVTNKSSWSIKRPFDVYNVSIF